MTEETCWWLREFYFGGSLCIGSFDCGISYIAAIITGNERVASACVLVGKLFPNLTEANNFPAHTFNHGNPISQNAGAVIFLLKLGYMGLFLILFSLSRSPTIF